MNVLMVSTLSQSSWALFFQQITANTCGGYSSDLVKGRPTCFWSGMLTGREREREKERTKKIEELKGETFLDDDKINRVGKHFFQTEAEKMKSAEFASSGWDTFSNKAKSTFFHLHSFFPPTSVKLQAKRR